MFLFLPCSFKSFYLSRILHNFDIYLCNTVICMKICRILRFFFLPVDRIGSKKSSVFHSVSILQCMLKEAYAAACVMRLILSLPWWCCSHYTCILMN